MILLMLLANPYYTGSFAYYLIMYLNYICFFSKDLQKIQNYPQVYEPYDFYLFRR